MRSSLCCADVIDLGSGAEELIGKWLQVRQYDYVALLELNGFVNESHFQEWAARHDHVGCAYLLMTKSGFHIGLVARRDKSCAVVSRRGHGFFHGVLQVRCAVADFFVTHLTPFEAKRRRKEAVVLADDVFRSEAARKVLFGDLNSPPYLRPYVNNLPQAIASMSTKELRLKLKSKFLKEDGRLDDNVARALLGDSEGGIFRDPCERSGADSCGQTVPTLLTLDVAHALGSRLDHILLAGDWPEACASTVDNPLTAVLSDHYPLEVVLGAPPLAFVERQLAIEADAILAYRHALQSAKKTEALSAAEAEVACRWTSDLADEERRARLRAESIAKQHRHVWQLDQSTFAGIKGIYWRSVTGSTSSNCREVCEQQLRSGLSASICLEGKGADPNFISNCNRTTAHFVCPFGCHVARGYELPAFVSDIENINAGRCLLPEAGFLIQGPTDSLTGLHSKNKSTHKKRKVTATVNADIVRPVARALNALGFEQINFGANEQWCKQKHPATSRLCPCMDLALQRARPLESCTQACSRAGPYHCHDKVLQTFNSRACPVYHALQNVAAVSSNQSVPNRRSSNKVLPFTSDSVTTSVGSVLPVILRLSPNFEVCIFAAYPFQAAQRCNATMQLKKGNLRPRHFHRLCPCTPKLPPASDSFFVRASSILGKSGHEKMSPKR